MTERVKQIKPRHVFGTLVLIAEAPILGAFVAGWLISGLMYVAAIGVERARGHGRNWRKRQREAPRAVSAVLRISPKHPHIARPAGR